MALGQAKANRRGRRVITGRVSQIPARPPSRLAAATDLALTPVSQQERRAITVRGSQIPAGPLSLLGAAMDLVLMPASQRERRVDMALARRPAQPPAPLRRMVTDLAPVP